MSDFTKEELTTLAYGLECCGMPNSDLRMRILKMVDAIDHQHAFQEQKQSFLVTDYRCDICGEKLIENN